ncbi:integral membrane sensor signal transduction histidine kinase [Clostridium sp. CAG:452]|jgi:integral membrane sensor signal transduction histidine kinase|nr:integral membrane sensor signal transduction histidine kinase [Clostridium sp. CAG:452]
MFTKLFTTIFGKKESIQRRIIKTAILYILIVIAIAAFLFYVFVQRSINIKLIEINEQQGQSIKDLLNISSRSIRVSIVSILLITIALMQNISRKIVNPIKKITDATKKVASGDFTIELETKRDDEIGELTHNFNKMVKELNSIECLQKDFINNVSHEIKTPISSIQGFAKLLEADDLSKEERKEYAEIIKEESDRLLYLSTNILKLAKLENQERIMNKTKFNIAEQIRRTISVLEPKWKEKNIKFNVSLKEQEFWGEKDLMYQVWMNIIENSIKFSKQDGQIDVKMKTNQDSIIVEIKDYGIGMEEEEAKKIFDRFYQVDKSHTKPGAGLGMTIAKRIVELSDGKIEVKSKLNESTTFIVTLPSKLEFV